MKKKDKTAALQREFQNFLIDVDSLLEESANLSAEEFSEAKAKLQSKVSKAKKSIVKMSNSLSDRARKSASKANREVHEEPWKAIAMGAVAGLVLGTMFTRR